MSSLSLKERMQCRQLGFDDIDPSFCNVQVGWVAPHGPKAGEKLYIWHPGGVRAALEFTKGLRRKGIVAWVVNN